MAIDYKKTAEQLVQELGGEGNILQVTHCATRLRFVLKDESPVHKERVNQIPGVITMVRAGGQIQVVIGNHVRDAYQFVEELVHPTPSDSQHQSPPGDAGGKNRTATYSGKKPGIFSRMIDIISGIFAPFLYALAACGILQGILGVLVAMQAIDTEGGTYQILNFISWTAFTFLPVLIAVTAAKKFDMNPFVALVIACALVCPDYIAMVEAEETVYFLGLRVQLLSYTSTVIPIILALWVASYLERFWNRVLPSVIRNLFSAMFTIAIMVPLTLLVFGPIGNTIGNAIGGVYNYLYALSPIIAGIIVGGVWEILVIFGVHWGITPVTVGNYATLGYDTFTGLQASAVFSQAGAALGVLLKSKNPEMKKIAASASVTGLFGITEPAIYGVNLRLKKPMICGCIAGAVGGAIAGAFRSVSWSYNIPGIATLPAFFKAGYTRQFVGLLISVAVSFVLGALLTYVVGFKEETAATTAEADQPKATGTTPDMTVSAPVSGRVIPLSQVPDQVFSSGALGKGVAIIPDGDTVCAPFDGIVEMLPDTGHAIGLRRADGLAMLIHVGIDTVKLNGQGFRAEVKEGDEVRAGTVLIRFEPVLLKQEGYDPTVMVLVTEPPKNRDIDCASSETTVGIGDPVLSLRRREVQA